MKTIVVGYDDTEAAKRALERAATLAQAFGSKLIITSVAAVLAPAGHGMSAVDPVDSPEVHEAELAEARTFLAALGLEAELVPGIGHPVTTIVDLADERDADLIVVGTRELGAVQRLFGGSVSAGVSKHAHCDVLIVH
jgi:nucleotide-binding universal stress UspA family protein